MALNEWFWNTKDVLCVTKLSIKLLNYDNNTKIIMIILA